MDAENQLFINRVLELSRLSYEKGVVVFSDFLNMYELNILYNIPKVDYYSKTFAFGGYEGSERQMVAFYQDAFYLDKNLIPISQTLSFPYAILSISPLNLKFSEQLTHRDFLGAILNLGIERTKVGDIIVRDECAYVFIHNNFIHFVSENLTRVRNTIVTISEIPKENFTYTPKYTEIKGTVPSLRLDAILSLAFSSSRNKLTGLIEGGKVFVNGKLTLSNSHKLKENDVISVRGHGKFRYTGINSTTKKNRFLVSIYKYL